MNRNRRTAVVRSTTADRCHSLYDEVITPFLKKHAEDHIKTPIVVM